MCVMQQESSSLRWMDSRQNLKTVGIQYTNLVFTEWNEKAATLLREMRVYGRHRRMKAEEAHGPPLESYAPAVHMNGLMNPSNTPQHQTMIRYGEVWAGMLFVAGP